MNKTRFVSAFAAIGILLLATAMACAQAPTSGGAPPTDYDHMKIKVDKLAHNFYSLTSINGNGRTGGAIGVLTGPDGILMVDAQFAPLTDKVVAAIKTFSNAPLKFMVNTHSHGDHTGGDPNFAKMGVTILSRPELRAALVTQKNFDPAGLPVITYTTPITLHMDGDEVVLVPVPPAHTDGDTMVYFRHADVLMTGDFFRAGYPNIGGTIEGMIAALGMAAGVCGPNTKVVPGHGPILNRADILAQRDMVAAVRDRVSGLIKQGKSEEEVIAAHPAAEYDSKYITGVAQYYDDGNRMRYGSEDAFLKQLYEQLKPKS
jgi:cyclase